MTAPSTTATAAVPVAQAGPPSSSGRRGELTITERAARHLVEGVVERVPSAGDAQVEVLSLADDGIELQVSLVLEYPTGPASDVLREVRRQVATETGRQLGRPVRRLDLIVSEFVISRPTAGRRVH